MTLFLIILTPFILAFVIVKGLQLWTTIELPTVRWRGENRSRVWNSALLIPVCWIYFDMLSKEWLK
jgi:hypothetical protein